MFFSDCSSIQKYPVPSEEEPLVVIQLEQVPESIHYITESSKQSSLVSLNSNKNGVRKNNDKGFCVFPFSKESAYYCSW